MRFHQEIADQVKPKEKENEKPRNPKKKKKTKIYKTNLFNVPY